MTKRQVVSLKDKLAATAAKRDRDISINRDNALSSSIDDERLGPAPSSRETPKTLPKVTLYAHANVLKAVRLLAVEDGVQAQEILRAAVRDYLATRGHHFTDLTTGE